MPAHLKSKKTRFTGYILSFICIVLIAFGVFLFVNGTSRTSDIQTQGNASGNLIHPVYNVEDLDKDAKTGILPGAPTNEPSPGKDSFGWRVNSSLSFRADGVGGELNLQNPPFNQYLAVAELCLKNDPNVLYRSRYIAPNQYIEEITLEHTPPSGMHQAVLYLNLVDPQTLRVIDILESPVEITIDEKQDS